MSRRQTFFKLFTPIQKTALITGLACALLIFLTAVKQVSAASPEPQQASSHLITVYDGDFEKTFVTEADTIRVALETEGIELEQYDKVEPSAESELVAGSYSVNVYRARPVTVVDGSERTHILTSAQSPRQVVEQAGSALYPEDLTNYEQATDPLEDGGAGLRLVIDRATPFEFYLYGVKLTARTQATTVGAMLKEKDITLGEKDGLSVNPSTKIVKGMTVKVWRDGKQTITEEKVIKKPVEEIKDADREVGYRAVRTEGRDGKRKVTYAIELRDGREISRKEIASVVLTEAVKEVVVVGTKQKTPNYSGSLDEWLTALRTCETGGNYQTNTGNGYYGAYQFLPSTWDSIARLSGRDNLVGVMPHNAAPADQDAMVIANTKATAGLSTQHPGCYQKLGLSNYPPN